MSLYSILVDIAANTAKFESGIEKVNRQLEQFGETAKRALEMAGVELGLQAVIEKFDQFVEHAAGLERSSQKVAMSVEELSKLEFAARQSGVATEQLTTGLERFAKNAEKAAGGSKEQSAAFAAMGVSVTDASGHIKPMHDLLGEVADKFAGYKDSVEKTALAQMLFGRAGAELIPLLNEGSRGIEEYGKRHEELGGMITQNTAKAAEVFHQKLNEVKDVMDAGKNAIFAGLLPGLSALSDYFVETAKDAGGLAAQTQPLVIALKFLTDAAFSVERTFADLGDALGALMAMANQVIRGHFAQAKEIWKDYMQESAKAQANAEAFLQKLWSDTGNEVDKLAAKMREHEGTMAAPIVNLGKAAKEAKTAIELLEEEIEKLIIEGNKQFGQQNSSFADRLEAENARAINSEHDRWLKSLEASQHTFDQMSVYADQAARNMQTAFANFLFNPFKDGMRGLLRNFVEILGKMASEAAAAKIFDNLFGKSGGGDGLGGLLGGLISKFFPSAGGGGADLGSVTSSAQGFGAAADAAIPNFAATGFALAGGGEAQAGQTYLVGERGPELFTPGASGYVTPNGALGGGDMRINMPINIDARGADADRVMTLVPPMIQQATQRAKLELLQAFRRSGLPAPPRA